MCSAAQSRVRRSSGSYLCIELELVNVHYSWLFCPFSTLSCVVEQRDSYVFWRRSCAFIGRSVSEICQNELWTKGIGQTGAEICHSEDGHIWCLIASRAQSLGGHADVCRGCRAQEAISGSHRTLCYNGELNGAAVRACRQILIGQCA